MHNREPNSNFGLIHFVNLGFDDPAESQVSIWRGKRTVITRITRQPDYLIFSQIFILQASELPPCLRCLIHKCCRSGRLFVTPRVWRYPSLKRDWDTKGWDSGIDVPSSYWGYQGRCLESQPSTVRWISNRGRERSSFRRVDWKAADWSNLTQSLANQKAGLKTKLINQEVRKKEDRPQLHSKWQSMNSWRDNNRKHSNGMGWLLCTYCYWVWIPIHIGQMVPAQY